MISKLIRSKAVPSKRIAIVGFVALALVLAGCGGNGTGNGEQTTVATEEGGVDTTVMEVEEGGEAEEGETTVMTEPGGVETTVITEEGTGTEMGTVTTMAG